MKNIWNLKSNYQELPKGFYQVVKPTLVASPKGLLFNHKLANELKLVGDCCDERAFPTVLVDVLSGNDVFEGIATIAQAYAGHQFGHFSKLGDGRAILLGEYSQSSGDLIDIQLKGSGPTSFSRRGDGRAALGPMLREYIISEAMYYLGVPSTRSLAVCLTGEKVFREEALRGAILTRIAKSHIRVGTFEYALAFLDKKDLKALADYVIDRHFPEVRASEAPYKLLLATVVDKQAKLVALWMKYGFIHGVMNTDNVSIAGETIDYGPCAFMEAYKPDQVYSSIDRNGRYAYNNQSSIAFSNLNCFAETLLPLLGDDPKRSIGIAEEVLSVYKERFENYWYKEMLSKIGLEKLNKENKDLLRDLLSIMEKNNFDFTNLFLHLTYGFDLYNNFDIDELKIWKRDWEQAIEQSGNDLNLVKENMKNHNPIFIPRNHLVEKALKMAEKDLDLNYFLELLMVIRKPFELNDKYSLFQKPAEPNERVFQTFCGT